MNSDTNPKDPAAAPAHPPKATREEPNPPASEDSVPQDDGTDNSWQMEPLEKGD